MGPGDPFASAAYAPAPERSDAAADRTQRAPDVQTSDASAWRAAAAPLEDAPSRRALVLGCGAAVGAALGVLHVVYGIGEALVVLAWVIGGLVAAWGLHALASLRLDFRGAMRTLLRQIDTS